MEPVEYPNYPEIFELIDFVKSQKVETRVLSETSELLDWSATVEFKIRGFSQVLHLDNEYKDFNISKPLLHAELCLAHLEDIEESTDVLQWCNWNGLKASDPGVLDYYQQLVAFNDQIRHLFGGQKIESFVLSFDFELNQRAGQALRNEDFDY